MKVSTLLTALIYVVSISLSTIGQCAPVAGLPSVAAVLDVHTGHSFDSGQRGFEHVHADQNDQVKMPSEQGSDCVIKASKHLAKFTYANFGAPSVGKLAPPISDVPPPRQNSTGLMSQRAPPPDDVRAHDSYADIHARTGRLLI